MVNSGSSANLVMFAALKKHFGWQDGDEIIVSVVGFPTTVSAIIQNSLIPVFVDINFEDLNWDLAQIRKAITSKTRAVFSSPVLGNPYNLDQLLEICNEAKIEIIADNCDSLGSKWRQNYLTDFAVAASCSFYPAHHITMGEGGAVFTNDDELVQIATSLRDWGRDCYCEPGKDNTCNKRFEWKLGDLPFGYDHKYTYSHLGYNLKITDMQAACGVSQLSKLDGFIHQRIINHAYLYDKFKKFEDYFILPEKTKNSEPSWFGFLLTIKNKKIIRNDLIKFLNMNKIGTRLLFAGNITKQPYMKNLKYRIKGSLENTDTVMTESFWIGVYPGLNREHLDYICSIVESYISKTR
jgi:CDP-6-deoxy-D-xylo-4-hexulose-3-dehydrase